MVGIYEDVGIRVNALQSSTRFNDPTSEAVGPAIGAIRTSHEGYQFELKFLSAGTILIVGLPLGLYGAYERVSTTTDATLPGQEENLLRLRGVVRAASYNWKVSRRNAAGTVEFR